MSWEKRPAWKRHHPAFRPPRLNSRKKRRNRAKHEALLAQLEKLAEDETRRSGELVEEVADAG